MPSNLDIGIGPIRGSINGVGGCNLNASFATLCSKVGLGGLIPTSYDRARARGPAHDIGPCVGPSVLEQLSYIWPMAHSAVIYSNGVHTCSDHVCPNVVLSWHPY